MASISCASCVLPAMVLFLDGMSRRLLGKEKHDYRRNRRRGVKAGRRPSRQRRVAAFTPRSDPTLESGSISSGRDDIRTMVRETFRTWVAAQFRVVGDSGIGRWVTDLHGSHRVVRVVSANGGSCIGNPMNAGRHCSRNQHT